MRGIFGLFIRFTKEQQETIIADIQRFSIILEMRTLQNLKRKEY